MVDSVPARVGVLIVGSLFWEPTPHRARWRRDRLDVPNAVPVDAPIRYGRRSQKRGDTYTMVFSGLTRRPDYRGGRALVVPCRRPVASASDLIEEARQLWVAESPNGSARRPLCGQWGAVCALFRSESTGALRDAWALAVREEEYPEFPHAVSEPPPFRADGVLTLPWPTRGGESPVNDLDILLATATRPTIPKGRYPRASQIAAAWVEHDAQAEYFFNNVQSGIRTFQDLSIWHELATSAKAGAFRAQYPRATQVLDSEVAAVDSAHVT